MKPAGESSEVPAKAGIRGRIPILYLVLFELILGSAISLGLFLLARNVEKAHSAQEFASQAGARHEALQRSLDGAVDAVYSVKALVESHGHVQREAFRVFAEHLLSRHPEILSVEWLPRVESGRRAAFTSQVRNSGFPDFQIRKAISPGIFEPAPEADEYFPVLYVEPLETNRPALGLDPGWEPSRAAIMRRARETRTAAATEPVELLRQPAGARQLRAVILFVPVYLPQPAEQAPAEARQALAGFARTVLLVRQLVETAWRDLPRGDMDSVIRDASDPAGPVYSYLAADATEQPAGNHAPLLRRQHWIGRVQLADRLWELDCVLSPAAPAPAWGWLTRSVLAGSAASTVLGAAYLRTALRRRQERDLAELTLRESSERFRNLFDSSPDAVFVESLDGRVLDANAAACRLHGLTRAELIGKAVADLVPPAQRPDFGREYGRLASGEIRQVEGFSWTADGRAVPVQIRASRISYSGQPALLLNARDVTERKQAEAAMQDRLALEARLSRLAAAAPGAIFTYRLPPDGTSCFPYVSAKMREWFGLAPEELRKSAAPAIQAVHPDDLPPLQAAMAEAGRTCSPWKHTFRARSAAGDWMHVEANSVQVREANGDVLFHGFLLDVTERERADQALHKSEQRFRNIYQNASTGIAITDWEGRFVQCNPAYCAILGYTEQELRQLTFESLIHPEDREQNLDLIRRLLNGQISSFEIENRCVCKNHTSVQVHKFVSVVRDDKDGPVNVMALVTDVTERRRAEEKVRRERERLRRMVDTAQAGIVFLSPEGKIREINDALLRMIGWTREEFAACGLSWQALTPPEYWELDRKTTREMLRHGAAEPAERTLLRKDGTRVPVLCNGVTLPGEEGPEFAVFVLDQTEQRRLENAVQDADEAIQGRIARDLHDGLGQQLASLLYLTRLLHEDLQARAGPEAARAAELDRLAKEAVDMTRQVARGLHPVPPEPDGLMLALEALAGQAGNGGGIDFVFECEPPVLLHDARAASHLYRIAQEAVTNAIKHSRATRIEIALWQDPAAVHLSVRDNGVGLLDGPAGHGLGMRTMKHRAQLIGGLLTLENASDGGAVVKCRVPRRSQPAPGEPIAPGRTPIQKQPNL